MFSMKHSCHKVTGKRPLLFDTCWAASEWTPFSCFFGRSSHKGFLFGATLATDSTYLRNIHFSLRQLTMMAFSWLVCLLLGFTLGSAQETLVPTESPTTDRQRRKYIMQRRKKMKAEKMELKQTKVDAMTDLCFYDSSFCALARSASSEEDCDAMPTLTELVCPTQTTVCSKSFNLTEFCDEKFGCPNECEKFMSTCCETSCCETTCLDGGLVCRLLDFGTCAEARGDICPCGSDDRTDEEYCREIVGDAGCIDKCMNFLDNCCNLVDGDLRLANPQNGTSFIGDTIKGRLEMFSNGQWGNICSDYFDKVDAKVACRQLGYQAKGTYQDVVVRTRTQIAFLKEFCSGL